MDGIVWLASYPKSGNTWFRTFISNLISEPDEEISINNMKTDGIFSSRGIVDSITGIETANMNANEIDRLRPSVFNHLAQIAEKRLFIKAHDAYTYLDDGLPLLGTTNAKAIYIMRNPLDVAVSFANHSSADFDRIISDMNKEDFAFCGNKNRLPNQLRQIMLTWSGHVDSWLQATELPVHTVRYEDMKLNPLETFTAAVRFIGLDCTEEQIRRAIERSDFDKLKTEEVQSGFKEKPYKTASFFRAGKTGDWRNHLNEAQQQQLIADHEIVMRKYGYLDNDGNAVY
ncbi:MAG: sulfotransferase domain-containing protein [Bacillota bacterium]